MKRILFCALLITSQLVYAQENEDVLTLDQCIGTALERNIQLQRAENQALIARANRFQAIMSFTPTVSAAINYDYFFGNFFDQNAARQVTEATNSSNPTLSGSLMLFNGFSNHYALKSAVQNEISTQASIDQAKLDVKSNVITAYLNAVLSQENLAIVDKRVELLESQLEREKKRVSVGVGSVDAVYNLQSQLASEKLNQVAAQNTMSTNMLSLVQLMLLDVTVNYSIESIDISDSDLLDDLGGFNAILATVFNNNPGIRAAEAGKEVARYTYKQSVSGRYPTISAFAQIGSNYSSNGATNPTLPYNDPVTGDPGYNFEADASFSQQMEYNQYEYINFSLNIPILNNNRTSRDIQVSRVGISNAELQYQDAVNSITNNVQQAYLDMLNAQATYISARDNLEAQNTSFEFIKKRFESGNTDFYSYLESLNNKNIAESQMVNAKYTIILRKRILDLYRNI